MIRGYCLRCRKAVGGFRNPTPWQCHRCRNLYCESCCKKKVGWIFKKPVCPECGIELAEGGSRFGGGYPSDGGSGWGM
ncbi:MAG: hypothetical protein ABSA72_09280 [Nitrososphaerales archaeon]|jgi:hypothetical protein